MTFQTTRQRMRKRRGLVFLQLSSFLLIGLYGVFASATPPTAVLPEDTDLNASGPTSPLQNPFAGLARSGYLLGNMGGLRPFISKYGLSLAITETSEVLGNFTGGVHRG